MHQQKHLVLAGMALSFVFLGIAAYLYPGGNLQDPLARGYSFFHNYISHLLDEKSLNGMANRAQPWAMAGAALMGVASGLALLRFAHKVGIKKYASVLQICGYLSILTGILVTVPSLHHLMVSIGMVVTLLTYFYLTVILFKAKIRPLNGLVLICLICYYGATYMFTTKTALEYMPLVQKTVHLLQIVSLLGLEYCTQDKDFQDL